MYYKTRLRFTLSKQY